MRAGRGSSSDNKSDSKGSSSHSSGSSKGTGGSQRGGASKSSNQGGFGTSSSIGKGGFGSGVGSWGGDGGFGSSAHESGFGGTDLGAGTSRGASKGGQRGASKGGLKSGDQGFSESFGIKETSSWMGDALDATANWVTTKFQEAQDWAFGKEFTGTAPMGAPEDYGLTNAEFDATIGKDVYESMNLAERLTREVDYFSEAPMDYASDLMDNPLVAGGMAMTGLGLTAFGIKAVDAAMDVYQGEQDPMGAAAETAAAGLSFTPLGAALPASIRGIAVAGLKKGGKAAVTKGAGVIGGTVSGGLGNAFANAVTDNPYARAAITSAAAVGGTWGATKAAQAAMERGKEQTTTTPSTQTTKTTSDSRTSPLISSGEKAVAESKSRMQPVQTDLYSRTVQQLPYYGLGGQTAQPYLSQPYYGV